MSILYYCAKCKVPVEIKFGSGKYCSRKCANSRVQTERANKLRSEKLKGKPSSKKGIPMSLEEKQKRSENYWKTHNPIISKCEWCGKEINLSASGKTGKDLNRKHFCNGSCRNYYLNANGLIGNKTWGVKYSKWELQFQEVLNKHGIRFEANKKDLIPSKLEIDIWLPDYKTAIELNGIWHYSAKPYGKHPEKLEERKRKDALKAKEVRELDYNFIVFKDDEIKDKGQFFNDFCEELKSKY